MPLANIAAQAGESQINLFEIYSNYNKPVDVSSGCIELNYYESLLDNSIRVTATLADTGFRSDGNDSPGEGTAAVEEEDLKLTAGEKVNLKLIDQKEFKLDFTGDKQLRIQEVRNIDESTNKMIFTIDLFSKESIDNELEENRVRIRFDGKISDTVEKILSEILKTPKNLDIDTTLNNLSILPTVTKPFYQLTWLGPRSVPDIQNAKGNLAGFFFYETYEGFKFKSIDKLFQQKPKKKLIFNNLIEREPPPGYDAKIEDFYFDSTLDLKSSMIVGSLFNTKIKAANAYDSKYRQPDFDYKNQELIDNMGGKEFYELASDLSIQKKVTNISYAWDDPGFLVEGKDLETQLPKSKLLNYDKDEILRQSYMRYNNLFTVKLSISIAGDMSLRAGDLLHCDFPEISSKKNTVVSQKKSGIYMIVDVCHRITKNGCYTRLNLVRDSIGRKAS